MPIVEKDINGLVDAAIIPININANEITINYNFMEDLFGVIEFKKNEIDEIKCQPVLELISATIIANKPAFTIISDLKGRFHFWYFSYNSYLKSILLYQINDLKATVVFKMIQFWIDYISNGKESDSSFINETRNGIIFAHNAIKTKGQEIKASSRKIVINTVQSDQSLDKENQEPQIEDIVATEKQVLDNMFIFNLLRDQKYKF